VLSIEVGLQRRKVRERREGVPLAARDEIGLIRGDLSTMDLGSGGWLAFAALAAVAGARVVRETRQ